MVKKNYTVEAEAETDTNAANDEEASLTASPKKKQKSSKKKKRQKSHEEEDTEESVTCSPKKKQKQPKKQHKTTSNEDDGLSREQRALNTLLFNYKFSIFVTFKELSMSIDVGEKTKSWVDEWMALKRDGIVIPGPEKGTFQLSEKGAAAAANGDENAMKKPTSNEEYHVYIKDMLKDKNGKKTKHGGPIFDLLLEKSPQTGIELADARKTNKDSHPFFYAFQQLKKMGMVEVECSKDRKKAYRLSDKAFPMGRPEITKKEDKDKASKDLKNDIVKQEENDKASKEITSEDGV